MELVPVILAAGGGSRMTSLTSHIPKPLLPIGSYPMIYYPVSMLERLGFHIAIIVTRKKYAEEIRSTLTECGVKMKLEIVLIGDQENIGSAEILRLQGVRSKIPEMSDLLVMGCDFVSDMNLNKLLHVFRERNASAAMLLTTRKDSPEFPVPSDKAKAESAQFSKNDMVVSYAEETKRLVRLMPYDDSSKEAIEYPSQCFIKYGMIRQNPDLTDCHVYVLKRWILEYLTYHTDCSKIKSIKYHLMPLIVQKSFPTKEVLEKSRSLWKTTISEDSTLVGPKIARIINKDFDIYAFAELYSLMRDRDGLEVNADLLSARSEFFGDTDLVDRFNTLHLNNDVIRCYIHIEENGLCERTNTTSAYCEANRQISKVFSVLVPQRKSLASPSATLARTAQVGPDCIIGDGSKFGEKASVKKSTVGKKCEIYDKVKIANSIIMDQVILHENCTLMNCIVFSGVCLAEACELKDCIVAPGVKLSAYGKFVDELITMDPKK